MGERAPSDARTARFCADGPPESRVPAVDDDLGRRLLELLGERGCVELLAVLELDEPERAALIGETPASTRVL